jgi:hypothetical protein
MLLALSRGTRAATVRRTLATFALDSPSFPDLRARRDAYVDKTSAIADLLMGDEGMHRHTRAFFARPRKFGKSLTLDIAAEMLAAGELPPGVAPWPGRVPVDVDAVFGGLAVHERLRTRDPTLRGLLQRAHFVVNINLGVAQTGAELKCAIFDALADAAGAAFGAALKAEVRAAGTTGGAMSALVSAVPRGVPVALFIDEYDAAIIQDVSEGDWVSAKAGIKALRSLAMFTKSPHFGSRIKRCLITGVARFSRTSLFSGANNFVDLTEAPLLSRALGFSEAEIRATFPEELAKLAGSLRTDVDGAVAQLAHWYNGYCFDGATSCFNPFPVLSTLCAGNITERELEAASGTNWLSLAPGAVVAGLAEELRVGARIDTASIDIDNLQAQQVRVVPLLLQTGLLSAVAGQPEVCRAPNEYARRSLQLLVKKALAVSPVALTSFSYALRNRNREAFSAAVLRSLEQLPRSLFKRDSGGDVRPREAVYHGSLFLALKATAPAGIDVQSQVSSLRGVADLVISFSGAPHAAAWVLEIGLGSDAAAKLPQAQDYAAARGEPEVFCCSVAVKAGEGAEPASAAAGGAAVALAWSRRVGTSWERA